MKEGVFGIFPELKFKEKQKNGKTKLIPELIFTESKGIDSPVISLIIPVLQEEKILEQTLKAYPKELCRKYNIELIVSDGGSNDKSVEIAKRFADRVVLHDKPYKQTIAEGRNNGANAAMGDVFVFINGDTIPDDTNSFFEFISKWNKKDNAYSSSDALACRVSVSPAEQIFKDRIFYAIHNSYVRLLNFFGVGMGRGECQIIKAEMFKKVGGYNPAIIAGEDFDLYRRLARIGKISFVNKLKVLESPRRFRKYGYMRIIFSWIINSISVLLFNRSVSKEWEAVR